MHAFMVYCFFFVVDHRVFYYSFGPCEAFRRTFPNHRKEAAVVIPISKKDLDSRMQQSFISWTNNKSFQYRLVYKCDSHQSHCTYILLHEETEAASKVKLDNFRDVSGEGLWKFTASETLVSISHSEEFKSLSVAFHDALNLYSSVVPSVLLSEVRTELKMATSKLESAIELGNFEAIQALPILNSFHKVAEKLADIECRYKVDMNKELQRNDIYFSQTKTALNGLDFISKNSIE